MQVDVTPYLAPYGPRLVRRPVRLELTEHSYPVEPSAAQSWLGVAFRAFSRIAATRPIRDLLIVGTGNGLDALGAVEIFHLRSLTLTDRSQAAISVARRNVLSHVANPGEIGISFHAGDLLSCVPAAKRFCLIYENLPNVRAAAGMDTEPGAIGGRFFDASELRVPIAFQTNLLALHYECLQQARGRLRDRGGILTALGGRIPLELAFDLHRACGYRPELVAFDVKPQDEAELVVPAYCEAEEQHGVEFTFYAPEAIEQVADHRRTGLEGNELAAAVEGELRARAMSAHEAMDRVRRGKAVAHSVLMILGERRRISS